jgi:hypothetical protein
MLNVQAYDCKDLSIRLQTGGKPGSDVRLTYDKNRTHLNLKEINYVLLTVDVLVRQLATYIIAQRDVIS